MWKGESNFMVEEGFYLVFELMNLLILRVLAKFIFFVGKKEFSELDG